MTEKRCTDCRYTKGIGYDFWCGEGHTEYEVFGAETNCPYYEYHDWSKATPSKTEKRFEIKFDGVKYFCVIDVPNERVEGRFDTISDAKGYLELYEQYIELEKENEQLQKKNDNLVDMIARVQCRADLIKEENEQLKSTINTLTHDNTKMKKVLNTTKNENEQIKQVIKEAYQTERTELGKSVLKQLMETIQ